MKRLIVLLSSLLAVAALAAVTTVSGTGKTTVSGSGKTTVLVGSSGTNLILNPGFETYTGTQDDATNDTFTAWNDDNYAGSYVESSATAFAGLSSMHISRGPGGGFPGKYQDGLAFTPGANLTLYFRRKGDGTAVGFYVVYDLINSAYILGPTTIGAGNTWTQITQGFTVPAGCTSGRVYFYGDTNSGDFWIDNVDIH